MSVTSRASLSSRMSAWSRASSLTQHTSHTRMSQAQQAASPPNTLLTAVFVGKGEAKIEDRLIFAIRFCSLRSFTQGGGALSEPPTGVPLRLGAAASERLIFGPSEKGPLSTLTHLSLIHI